MATPRLVVPEPAARASASTPVADSDLPAAASAPPRPRFGQGLGSLAYPNFRLLVGGGFVSYTGDWMEQVALNWLVLNLSGSPLDVGLLNFFRLIPLLVLPLVGGAVADRMDRRDLMVRTQTVAMLLSFATAALAFSPWLSLWPLLVLSVLRGAVMSFDRPARQALIPGLVPRAQLMNAVTLHSGIRNLTQILGPSVGGICVALVGAQWTILLNALTFIAVIAALLLMRLPGKAAGVRRGVGGLGEGLAYARREPTVRTILLLTLVPMVLGVPYIALVPVFAKDVLHVGASGYGFLMGASGVGALIGAITLAVRSRGSGRLLIGGALLFGGALVGFALSPWFALSALLLVVVGISTEIYFTVAQTLLQTIVPDALRGRVMSLYLMDRGLTPLGALIAGAAASAIGAPFTLAAMGGLCALLALAAAPRLFHLNPTPRR